MDKMFSIRQFVHSGGPLLRIQNESVVQVRQSSEMKNRIMIVAGGEWQIPLVQKAKSLGMFVINTNLFEDSPAFEFADVGVVADVLDKQRNLRIALKYHPEAILTDQSDIAVPTVAWLCEQLKLPGIGVETADLFTNKYKMREFCRSHGFPHPEFELCRDVFQAKRFAERIGYPIIIKPTCNQSSRGVFRVDSGQMMDAFYPECLKHSKDLQILAEDFLEGTEFTVEGIKTNDQYKTLAISRKSHFSNRPVIASNLLYTKSDKDFDYQRLAGVNDTIVYSMKLPFGITHAEYICHDDEFYLIEVAARGGGTKISSHIIPIISGVDANRLLIEMSLGQSVDEVVVSDTQAAVLLDFFSFKPGKVVDIVGLSSLNDLPGLVEYGLNFKKGDVISEPLDDRSRHGFFIVAAANATEVIRLSHQVKESVGILYDDSDI